MRFLKIAVAVAMALACGSAYAFHDGGVAACEGCHVMHNASGGASVVTARANSTAGLRTNVTNSYLLQGSDQSSTCLICHSGNGAQFQIANWQPAFGPAAGSTASTNFTPGGDFGWLIFGGPNSGNRKAHNVVAKDYAFNADTITVAPGGSFASGTGTGAFACSNCHDPHGRYRLSGTATNPTISGPNSPAASLLPITGSGSYGAPAGGIPTGQALGVYRLLAGQGYTPASNPGFPFPNNPPAAVAPGTYNQSEAGQEVRVAYGRGMSEWCQNCHTNIHLDAYVTGGPGLRHPAGNGAKLVAAQFNVYNSYISSGNLTGVNRYSSLVPFEVGTNDISTTGLVSGAQNQTPGTDTTPAILVASGASNVMCISCHRAHGSGFDSITRWDNSPATTLITGATAFNNAAGLSPTQTIVAYYGRGVNTGGTSIGSFQRSLCNKCHGKD
jgi:hypothetical protein